MLGSPFATESKTLTPNIELRTWQVLPLTSINMSMEIRINDEIDLFDAPLGEIVFKRRKIHTLSEIDFLLLMYLSPLVVGEYAYSL
jgi:hypothetical protein